MRKVYTFCPKSQTLYIWKKNIYIPKAKKKGEGSKQSGKLGTS